MSWECFMVEESGWSAAWLRRYRSGESETCPDMPGKYSYHQAMTRIENLRTRKSPEGYYESTSPYDYQNDHRWPKVCSCGYLFDQSNFGQAHTRDGDTWQVLTKALMRRPGNDLPMWTVEELPPGAMFDTPWLVEHHKGPDGRSMSVKLPPGGAPDVWHIDFPSSSGGGWQRTGTPPNLTVTPSILTPRYHGFLTNGALTDPV